MGSNEGDLAAHLVEQEVAKAENTARKFGSTMIDAIDIYRAAKLVIDPHGEDAALCVAAKTAMFDVEGDDEGAAI